MIMKGKSVRESVRKDLKARKRGKQARPGFKRQEQDFQKILKKGWRRPRGRHSKLRVHEKGRGGLPSPGYGSPASVRGLNRLGYREVMVSNLKDLGRINPKEEMGLISSGVGRKKRGEIVSAAKERKIMISNE
jgi:large subunit ribosomal protein L32e